MKWLIGLVGGVMVVSAMVTWGLRAHRESPHWAPSQTFTRKQAMAALRRSVADLKGAAVVVHLAGPTSLDLEGAVAFGEPIRAALRVTDSGVPQQAVVRLIGAQAWAQTRPKAAWAHTTLGPTPTGQTQTVLAQVAGAVDLQGLLTDPTLGVRSMEYKRATEVLGKDGTAFTVKVSGAVLRAAFPGLVDTSATQVPFTVVLDDAGRLLALEVQDGAETLDVSITTRNPTVVVEKPTGKTVPLPPTGIISG